MKILKILSVTLVSFSLIAGGWIFFANTSEAQELVLPHAYEITDQSQSIHLLPEQPGLLVVTLRNTGSVTWQTSALKLHSIYFDGADNRASTFANSTWIDQKYILPHPTNTQTEVNPNKTFTFYIPITAPSKSATYQETFHLYHGENFVAGNDIKWIIQVGDSTEIYTSSAGKQVRIWLAEQRLWAIQDGVVVMDTLISSGKPGYNTPKGNYTILNHIETAYSSPYQLWMDNWMALKRENYGFTGYGLHALPYWKVRQGSRVEGEVKNGRLYTDGKLYEDYEHLGKPMSHGCVRLGIEASRALYRWAENGTPVIIA